MWIAEMAEMAAELYETALEAVIASDGLASVYLSTS